VVFTRILGGAGIIVLSVVACDAGSAPSGGIEVGDGTPGILEHPHAVSTAREVPSFVSAIQNIKKSIEETVKAKKKDLQGSTRR
jgi:hypothetical protein